MFSDCDLKTQCPEKLVFIVMPTEHEFCKVSSTLGIPGDSDGKEPARSVGDTGSILGSGRVPGRREWQPAPVLLPGEFQGQRSLVGYGPGGRIQLSQI